MSFFEILLRITLLRNPQVSIAELPVSGVYSGVAQGVLRVNAAHSDAARKASIRKAFDQMSRRYPEQTLYVTVTANVILRATDHSSFSVYFGQSFGNAKAIFFGQEHNPDTGEISKLFTEYEVTEASDLEALPRRFTTEDFAGLYKRNFERSKIAVHQVISHVYLFGVGLEKYERDRTLTSRTPLRIF